MLLASVCAFANIYTPKCMVYTTHTGIQASVLAHTCACTHTSHTHKESSIHNKTFKSLKYVGLKFLKKNGRENEVKMIFEEKIAKADVRQRLKNLET